MVAFIILEDSSVLQEVSCNWTCIVQSRTSRQVNPVILGDASLQYSTSVGREVLFQNRNWRKTVYMLKREAIKLCHFMQEVFSIILKNQLRRWVKSLQSSWIRGEQILWGNHTRPDRTAVGGQIHPHLSLYSLPYGLPRGCWGFLVFPFST